MYIYIYIYVCLFRAWGLGVTYRHADTYMKLVRVRSAQKAKKLQEEAGSGGEGH